jgi:hypothetical protein
MRLTRWARSALGELFGVAVRVGRGLGKGTANGVFFRRPSVQPTQIKLLSSGRLRPTKVRFFLCGHIRPT